MSTSEKEHINLSTAALTIGYKQKREVFTVAENLELSCHKGALIGLVGANGIGKSTLLRTLSGMQAPLSGQVLIESQDLATYDLHSLAKKMSVVLTEAPVSKNLRVKEFVSLGRQPHTNWLGRMSSSDEEIIQRALDQTEVTALVTRRCYELSDGQFQRVAIARALAQDTPIILLDEPTTHLDLYHRVYVLKLLKKLSQEMEKTILFSSHEIDLAIQLSDRMIVMTKNKVHQGTPAELISEGIFNTLFPEKTIGFDPITKRFTIEN